VAESPPLSREMLRGKVGAGGFLDLLVHQLFAHAAVPEGVA